jgi:non-specific serine/threonine protein kinase
MGEVFLARDTRLDRKVALKVLPAHLNTDADRVRRFLEEARAASALTHPNVAVIYDIGDSDDVSFIAMEYVDGHTLAARCAGEPMATREIVDIGCQIADALQSAHASGVVHRDITAANLMITAGGHVKVLDFGLAKIARANADTREPEETHVALTQPGVVMGTVAYMSPEQATGAATDHRTDLFSLGVVLYQALTGRVPFAGATTVETIDQIRHASPEAIARFNYAVPAQLERIIYKCLEKEPARRYQSAQELLVDLRNLARDSDGHRVTPIGAGGGRHNLPEDLTSFVGRRDEVRHVSHLFASSRFVTLTGAGGCGKTRLATRIGADMANSFTDGVWFVDLAALADPDLLPNVVARALALPEGLRPSFRDALVEWLRTRNLLLILDNCEHLIDACAALAETLLRKASQLRILATSREGLGVQGETVWSVPSLAVPQDAAGLQVEEVLQFDGVRLFVDRAAAVAPFTLTPTNATTVTAICRRLDGIPLAIELAAARVKILSVEQINARLQDRFRLLTGGARTAVARQRTLEATVDWSYELLSDTERRLLMRLTVFAGGWPLEAAEHVCSDNGIDSGEVMDLLSHLVNKSLVTVEESASGERRYRLLETIRQYGRDRLFRSGESDPLNARHFAYFLALAQRARPELIRAEQVSWLNRLDLEHDNLRAALEWSAAGPDRRTDTLTLALCVWWFWTKRGYFSEGRRRLEDALAASPEASPEVETQALVGLFHLTSFQGDVPASRAFTARCLSTARRVGDLWAEAFALGFEAIFESDLGNFERSVALASEAHAVAVRSTHPNRSTPTALALRMLAYGALQAGDLPRAGLLLEEAVALMRGAGEIWALGILVSDLAALRVLDGRHELAGALSREALGLCQSLGDRRGIGWCLQTIAMLEAGDGRASRAAMIYGAAEALLQSIGATGQVTVTRVQDRYLSLAMEALGESAFREAAAEGRRMPLPRILDVAVHQGP